MLHTSNPNITSWNTRQNYWWCKWPYGPFDSLQSFLFDPLPNVILSFSCLLCPIFHQSLLYLIAPNFTIFFYHKVHHRRLVLSSTPYFKFKILISLLSPFYFFTLLLICFVILDHYSTIKLCVTPLQHSWTLFTFCTLFTFIHHLYTTYFLFLFIDSFIFWNILTFLP